MKKFAVLLLLAFALPLTACGSAAEETPETLETPETVITTAAAAPVTEPGIDLSPLELIGYRITENGDIIIDADWENECDIDTYRNYFFGIWTDRNNNSLIIDDSEKNNCFMWLTGGIYKLNNAVVGLNIGNAACGVYWLDTDNPDIMYYEEVYGILDGDYGSCFGLSYNFNKDGNYQINRFTKTDLPVNQPENGFLSKLRLREIAQKYGIEYDMLVEMEYADADKQIFIFHDNNLQAFPVYLVSESENKLVFKTQMGNVGYDGRGNVDVIYTVEKTDGEWAREIEMNREQLEALSEGTTATISLDEEIQKRMEKYKEQAETENDYGTSVIVKLKETDYDFSQEGKSMEEIIKILWDRNIVCFYTYYQYIVIYHYRDTDSQKSDDYKVIHYYFSNYDELKKFVQETYVSEYADSLIYDDNGRLYPYYGDNEVLMCEYNFFESTYIAIPFHSEVKYKIINTTDEKCEFVCYFEYYYDYINYVILEIPCTAVKENGKWQLTEMIGNILSYDDLFRTYDFVPFETYKIPR